MGSMTPDQAASSKRYRVTFCKADHTQRQKRVVTTKRGRALFLANIQVDKSGCAYLDPSKACVLWGSGSTRGWPVAPTGNRFLSNGRQES